MNKEQLYPQSVEKLYEKIKFIIKNEQNQEKILQLTNWVDWFESQKYDFKYVCNDNEFLKIYFNDDKYALQVWKHNDDIDSIEFNLLSNYYSEYDNELTEIIE